MNDENLTENKSTDEQNPAAQPKEESTLAKAPNSVGSGVIPYGGPTSLYAQKLQKKESRLKIIINNAKGLKAPIVFVALLFTSILAANIVITSGFGSLLMPVCVPILYVIFYFWKGVKSEFFSAESIILLVFVFLLCSGFILNNDSLTNTVTMLTLVVLIPIQLSMSTQNETLDDFSIVKRTAKAFTSDTFSIFPKAFKTFTANKEDSGKSSKIKYILIGIACTIPFLIVLISLFANGDDMFRSSLGKIDRLLFENTDALTVIFSVILGAIAALYLFPLFIRLKYSEMDADEEVRRHRGLNAIAVTTFLIILILLELTFSFIQVKYLFLNMGVLAEGETYAQYARSGFFEISAATILTIAIIFVTSQFTQKKEDGRLPLVIKILLTVFSLCVCLMFASSYYRMFMYISAYSLTVKRVAVCWLMALMLLVLAGILIKLWAKGFKLMQYVVYTVLVSVLALNVLSVESFVAKYNVDKYLDEKNTGFILDIDYLGTLTPASLPQIKRIADKGPYRSAHNYNVALEKLITAKNLYETNDFKWQGANVQLYRAKKTVEETDYANMPDIDVSKYFIKDYSENDVSYEDGWTGI